MIQPKRKEFKLPDYTLPCPKLADFGDNTFFYRNETETFVKGVGNKNANIMFIAACPMEEDVDPDYSYSDPCLLKAESETYFKRLCLRNGINLDNEYFTTLVKYPLPRKYKLKPKAEDIKYCQDLLEEEIAYIKPSIIVCLGKEAATYILGINTKLAQIEESWLTSKKYNAKLYIIEDIQTSYYKPEFQDKMERDIYMLSKHYSYLCEGKSFLNETAQNYSLIETEADLLAWLAKMKAGGFKKFAVDCEWGGISFVDGTLRSIQFCWEIGHAVFIHFHNDQLQWVFDKPKDVIYKHLANFFNDKSIKFLGHNIAADYQWMYKHIGIDIYDDRCYIDTMFGLQVADEYADLKLEKLAAKYTDLGRYDIELLLWKKANKGVVFNEDEGYGAVPIEILFPYGCKDVDTTFRMAPIVEEMLRKDNTWDYYTKCRNPFVTDGFAELAITGIPFDTAVANRLRVSYLVCKEVMKTLFRTMLVDEAKGLVFKALSNILGEKGYTKEFLDDYKKLIACKDFDEGIAIIKRYAKAKLKDVVPAYKHYFNIDSFNYLSAQHKQSWLFDVKKYTPIKTTKSTDGNSVEWDKVVKKKMEKQYTPAVDKDTLKVYATAGDDLCQHLLQMSAVDTITKTFLKGDEGGLQKYVSSDGRIHTNFCCTETGK